MGNDRWFADFERNLAENGWLDHPERDDLYEQAAEDAQDHLADQADYLRKLAKEQP